MKNSATPPTTAPPEDWALFGAETVFFELVAGGLPERDRAILTMRHAEELSYEEIGYLLEIKPSDARQRYGRALIRLQSVLSAHGLLEDRS